MTQFDVKQEELERRRELATHARQLLSENLQIVAEDETSIMTCYHNFYVQISFSEMHPLLVIYFARELNSSKLKKKTLLNTLNLKSVLGSHSVNEAVGCYTFRATIWMDTELQCDRFYEIFDRCADEACRGFEKMAG